MNLQLRTHIGIVAAISCLAGCIVAFQGNFSFPGTACRTLQGWCVVEVPSAGYLAYGTGNSGQLDHTMLSFRLAPLEGVTVAWSSTDVVLVDLDTSQSRRIQALDTKPVTGRRADASIAQDLWVLYGPYAPGQLRLEPRIAKMEVRMPPILRDGQLLAVAPVRIHDGRRTPSVAAALPQ